MFVYRLMMLVPLVSAGALSTPAAPATATRAEGEARVPSAVFDATTERGVRAFQRAHGIPQTGMVGALTRRALRLPAGRVLKLGMTGPDVLAVKDALARSGAVLLRASHLPGPATRATATPLTTSRLPAAQPSPTPAASPFAPLPTPTGRPASPSPEPTPSASALFRPFASPAPTAWPERPAVPDHLPGQDLWGQKAGMSVRAGAWFNGLPASSAGDVRLDYAQPSWVGGLTGWLGPWGASVDAVDLNPGWVATAPVRFYQPSSWIIDGLVHFRPAGVDGELLAGYRVMTQHGVDFVTLGGRLSQPMLGSWLSLEGEGLAGFGTSLAYTFDVRGGLALRIPHAGISLGYRSIMVSRAQAAEPAYVTAGPYMGVEAGF